MNLARDPFLDLPLDGLRLIEASAGTGKTYTLATLVARLVIERGLRVGEILAVTFTDAATQELRERLRRRLLLAARIAADDPALPVEHDDAERSITRELVRAQAEHEGAAALRTRLQRAAREIDLAAVVTIHGFCARVLAEHALETGQAFAAPEMIGSERELLDEIALDVWRAFGSEATAAELLSLQWPGGPSSLASDLGALLRAPLLLPPAPAESADPLPHLLHAADALRASFARHGDDAFAALDAAIAGKVLNGNSYRANLPRELWSALNQWSANGDAAQPLDERIEKLTPAALIAKTNKGKDAATPASPLFDAVAAYLDAAAQRAQWMAGQAVSLVHRIRDAARARLAELKRVRRVQSFDDLIGDVAAALEGPDGEALARRLREQYAVALVDEFQDTDPRQWAIFQRVFAQRALFLIGDPKQAIYGFRGGDVHTYLTAAALADQAPPLDHNFRSRPSLLRAISALYAQAGETAFVDTRIAFREVQAGGAVADADLRRDGATAPALTVRALPAPGDGRKKPEWSAPESRELAARACVAAIHGWLRDAREGRATIGARALQPADIAVLVRSHDEAARIQQALIAAGIPAVAAGRRSLFATAQAMEVLTLFDALLHPGDGGRLRAALATVLIGLDGAAIAQLARDEDLQRDWQLRALAWRERWQRHGPLALIADLCAEHAPRLLGLNDGERRLTNTLQLGETLQEADTRSLGLHGLRDWLRLRIAEADDSDEKQQLRLESDAHRVQILTLHKSKGLEFGLVFMPFVAIGREPRGGRWCEYPDPQHGRIMQLQTQVSDPHTPDWDSARERAAAEARAEDARLLYVGLTRARHALWIATGPLYLAAASPLRPMLSDLDALARGHEGEIVIDAAPPEPAPTPLPPLASGAVPPAREARRSVPRDWWVYSFTQLTNEDGGVAQAAQDERGAEDEPQTAAAALTPGDARYSGSRFGNVVHNALERVDFAAWRGWTPEQPAPDGAPDVLAAAMRGEGYVEADIDDGLPLLTSLVGLTLTARMPEGARLCEVAEHERRSEMEFHFALESAPVDALLAALHAHGWLRERRAFGLRRRLEGLMTGKIDLVYAFEGRYYVLDYKTNRLPDYEPAQIERAMNESEYTLQSLIYTIALHRWLRFRLGEAYDYARDFGGVRYLFCRGLDPGDPAAGVHADKPARELVDAIDALFAGRRLAS
ncbi:MULTISPECIES: exodeoxyribonuclease V subunit beta [unclassified Lysobacter]|uniref:exodeoxyribonuclease V subunit beta n=1 Tax=unclassified Lysobacter TaxID=2635362 RepID=UPI001BEAE910|nr:MULTISPECIES: exodeoxyribonuclease V subunit beta [unclassified Lysobacter]MBT2746886.1 exodeoxyribonuclease V subunit beta [Lysobacter sp. ISL-42]MBT2753609.1 exodeoxyribonuclease V subunit beta [Lysobacter sp. ISL-50]MBT2779775.1 exodeoxyribonuclease V subunit beta [Lysobacter sp. ISL-54]MBT2784357.1 exodeoxyribonuclease V subunit beta [Lysobacter sp. ISL-52]